MKKWEYHLVLERDFYRNKYLDERLNTFAVEGWRLVAINPIREYNGNTYLLMEREIVEEAE